MSYFSGQGKVYVAPVTAGVAGAFRYLGDVKELRPSLETEIEEVTESTSGNRLTALRLQKAKRGSFSMQITQLTAKNLALAFFGTEAVVAGSTVTNEALPSGLAVGDIVRTVRPRISSVVVKDSAGSPATLVAGTDYRINSADHGSIEILNLGSYVQPFKVDYSYASHQNVPWFTSGVIERWLRFEGLNTADANKPVLVEMYRCAFDPVRDFPLIQDEVWRGELNGSMLLDETKAGDATLGQFGRAVLLY